MLGIRDWHLPCFRVQFLDYLRTCQPCLNYCAKPDTQLTWSGNGILATHSGNRLQWAEALRHIQGPSYGIWIPTTNRCGKICIRSMGWIGSRLTRMGLTSMNWIWLMPRKWSLILLYKKWIPITRYYKVYVVFVCKNKVPNYNCTKSK